MKHTLLRVVLSATFLFLVSIAVPAQVVVRVRPNAPVRTIVRPVAPSPRHVWIDGGWVVTNGRYVWHEGYWVVPPRGRVVWANGRWGHRKHGWVWIPGHWRRR